MSLGRGAKIFGRCAPLNPQKIRPWKKHCFSRDQFTRQCESNKINISPSGEASPKIWSCSANFKDGNICITLIWTSIVIVQCSRKWEIIWIETFLQFSLFLTLSTFFSVSFKAWKFIYQYMSIPSLKFEFEFQFISEGVNMVRIKCNCGAVFL